MNVVFAGTPPFAVPFLSALLDHCRVLAVYTQPDRPAGRGQRVRHSAVKELALRHGLALHQPATLKHEQETIAALQPDLMVVVAYGLLVPPSLLTLPRFGCINAHASLLPRWRGATPVLHAIDAGDRHSGVTLMQMDEGLDTGDVLCHASVALADDDSGGSLHRKLSALGAELLANALPQIETLRAARAPQDNALASYAPIVRNAGAHLDWSRDAAALERRIRAMDPSPGARTLYRGAPLKLWRARAVAGDSGQAAGVVVGARGELLVQTGDGLLSLLCLQRAGGRRLDAADFLNGVPLAVGEQLGG